MAILVAGGSSSQTPGRLKKMPQKKREDLVFPLNQSNEHTIKPYLSLYAL